MITSTLVKSDDEFFILMMDGRAESVTHHGVRKWLENIMPNNSKFCWQNTPDCDILKASNEWGTLIAYWNDDNRMFSSDAKVVSLLKTAHNITGRIDNNDRRKQTT